MGKLKFTLLNIWFWVALAGVSILSENLVFLSPNMKNGHTSTTLLVLAVPVVISLFMFFFINHRRNKMKIDFVLLPIIIILGLAYTASLWMEPNAVYQFLDGSGQTASVTFTAIEKLKTTIILWLFLAFTYAMLFMFSRTQPHSKLSLVAAYVAMAFTAVCITYSLIAEWKEYAKIFDDNYKGMIHIVSFFGNKNYYGGIIFVGILTCMIVNYHRPRFIWYVLVLTFMLFLISTAAILPTLIAIVAVPIYLLIDIIRFSVRRKWFKSAYVTIVFLGFLTLLGFFYYGSLHEWKGFGGSDEYFTHLLYSKDFDTLTGRFKIWAVILPHCFDSPIHALFGHGFMITQKSTMALVATLFGHGVRTTHNGIIQVLFEFGVVGLLIHLILVCYFVFSCIKLMTENKFYCAYIYLFVALCVGVYNFAESSPIFGYGIKELYMTLVFFMPMIARGKSLFRKKVLDEAKELPVKEHNMDPVALGKGLTGMIVAAITVLIPMFLTQFTYEWTWLSNILVMILLSLLIGLLFIPYLATLYYKKCEKSHFVANCVLNAIGIFLPLFMLSFFLIRFGYIKMAAYAIPPMLMALLLVNTVIYCLFKDGSIKQWSQVVIGGLWNKLFPMLITMIVGIATYLIIQGMGRMDWFTYLFSMLITVCTYYALAYFVPFKDAKHVLEEYNNVSLLHNKDCVLKDETYNG